MHFRAERSPTRWTLGVESERFGRRRIYSQGLRAPTAWTIFDLLTRYAVNNCLRPDYVYLRVRHGRGDFPRRFSRCPPPCTHGHAKSPLFSPRGGVPSRARNVLA